MGQGRRLVRIAGFALAMFAAHGAGAQNQTQTFAPPIMRGVLLDWCAHFGSDCGQPAADLFCREVGFDRAARILIDPSAGERGIPTLVFGDGALCQGPNCAGFRAITCERTVAAQPPAPDAPADIGIAAPPPPPPPSQPPPPPPVVAQPPPPPPPPLARPPVLAQPPPPPPPPVAIEPPPVRPPVAAGVPIPRLRPEPAPAPAAVAAPVKPKIPSLVPAEVALLPMGEIHLTDPRVEPDRTGEFANPLAGQIPVWDDETVFKWRPSNPGMADTYELRMFASRAAADPLGSVRIPGNRTYARPGIDFLTGLLESAGVRPGPQDDIWALISMAIGAKEGNLFWEVAGFRGYDDGGEAEPGADAAAAEPFEAEVAVSERWPLRTTDRPNGFGACGPGEGQAPELNKANLDFKNIDALADGRPGSDYVFDRIRLEGQFSLVNSPYAAHPSIVMGPPPPGGLINLNVAAYRFDTLFIDWGDGEVGPLTLDALDHGQYGRGSLLGLPRQPPLEHRYERAGTYTVRIFQVSEADVQLVHVGNLNVAFQTDAQRRAPGAASQPANQPVGYNAALAAGLGGGGGGGVGPAAGATASAGNVTILQGGFPLAVANRAYVVYCKPVKVSEPKDEVAYGPLVLYSVDVAFDPAHAVDEANPVAARVAACDRSARARAHLAYAGKGRVSVTWKIDGLTIGGVTEHEIGPSPPRSGAEIVSGAAPRQGSWESNWIALEVPDALTGHEVTVEITVKEPDRLILRLPRPGRDRQEGAPPVIQTTLRVVLFDLPDGTTPKKQVVSPARTYTVVESDPDSPCRFRFVVAGGAFDVYLPDPDAVSDAGGNVYAGTGNMLVRFADRGGDIPVPVSFGDWQVADDGIDVVAGTLAVDGIAGADVNLPGLGVSLTSLAGSAGSAGAVEATIDVRGEGGGLRDAGGTARPPVWPGERARLAPDGDWYKSAAGKGIAPSLIGWSGFSIDADTVALDFSAGEGSGPGNACGGAGTEWIGAMLADARVEPNLLSLDTLRLPADGWVIGEHATGNGLCGDLAVDRPVPRRPVGEGAIAIDRIAATVRGGFVKDARYDMAVEVPILGVRLAGTARLTEKTGDDPSWNLTGLTGPPADIDLGTVRLQASDYSFGSDVNGWRVSARTRLTLTAEARTLATIDTGGVRYGLDGRVRFDDAGATARAIALGGRSGLGDSPVDLLSATLSGPPAGATRLGVQVATRLHLSDALPAPDVGVTYAVAKAGDRLRAEGPTTTPFEIEVAFPPGDPGITARIRPQYVGGRDGTASAIKFYAGPGNATVDLLGGAGGPIQSAFVLGTAGGSDYWMTLTDYDLGPTGTPLVPPILNLFRVSGGLGYHVDASRFIGLGDVRNISPDTGSGLTFLAGITAGTADHVVFTVDGQLKMTGADKPRLDFTAWLLKERSGGSGDFTGFIQYGGGSFDGQLWGGLSILSGAVRLTVPQSAVDMHFGAGGPWHIYLGRRDGPKIEATLLNLGGTSGYLMLSADGFFVGSGARIDLGGDVGPFSATVKGWLDAELGLEPLIPRVSGSASGGLSVKGCAFGLCIGPTISVKVTMAALPIDVSARACFEVDLLLKTVRACGNVSL